MIIYLDQNHIIDLSKNITQLDEFHKIIQKRKASLGISFSHIIETVNDDKEKRESIIRVIDHLGYVELNHIIKIMDAEVINEFYRYLNLSYKVKEIQLVLSIFSKSFHLRGFAQIVRFFSEDPERIKNILKHKKNHEGNVRELLEKSSFKSLQKERSAILDYYIKSVLNPKHLDLSIVLPPKSLDAQDFKKHFSWQRCPYLSFYTLFQSLRYRDAKRDPRGDLPDLEHATVGALSCDILCIEKNAYEIINQTKRHKGIKINSKVFKKLDETIKFLN